MALAADVDGIISVGTGSLNDMPCFVLSELKKMFCIFATAPSMDGFASNTAPIIENFKTSWQASSPPYHCPTQRSICQGSPLSSKAAGFGDMVAKYIEFLSWKVAHLLIDEYCDAVMS